MKNINEYKVAIFDCDGVILDSNQVKSNAFSLALDDEDPNLVTKFIDYHQKNGGISRYIKFEHFFSNIKKSKDYNEDLTRVLKRYADLSKKGLLECNEVPGVRNILQLLNKYNISCYVASGGDQTEVISVLKKRDLFHYFDGVYGSPLSKTENLNIIDSNNRLQLPGLYFGDAKSDMLAAVHYDLEFIFISGASEWKEGIECCTNNNIKVYDNFESLMGEI